MHKTCLHDGTFSTDDEENNAFRHRLALSVEIDLHLETSLSHSSHSQLRTASKQNTSVDRMMTLQFNSYTFERRINSSSTRESSLRSILEKHVDQSVLWCFSKCVSLCRSYSFWQWSPYSFNLSRQQQRWTWVLRRAKISASCLDCSLATAWHVARKESDALATIVDVAVVIANVLYSVVIDVTSFLPFICVNKRCLDVAKHGIRYVRSLSFESNSSRDEV